MKIIPSLLLSLILFSCSKTGKQENTTSLTINPISPTNNGTFKKSTDSVFLWSATGSDVSVPVYYKIKIVEISANQSSDEALRTNKPFFERDSIERIRVTIPRPSGAGGPGLILDKKYVWQITGKQKLLTGSSSLSVFTVVP